MATIQEEAQELINTDIHKRQVEQTAQRLAKIADANNRIAKWQKEIDQIAIAPIDYEDGERRY